MANVQSTTYNMQNFHLYKMKLIHHVNAYQSLSVHNIPFLLHNTCIKNKFTLVDPVDPILTQLEMNSALCRCLDSPVCFLVLSHYDRDFTHLCSFSSYPTCQFDILWHYCDMLHVNCAKVGILEQIN